MRLQDLFFIWFTKAGYKKRCAESIFPSPDSTTLFTCATISALKHHLVEGSIPSVCMVQPCLRVQNLTRSLDKTFDPEYLSYFKMPGTLCSVENFDLSDISGWFMEFPELNDRMIVRSSKKFDLDLFDGLHNDFTVIYDDRPPTYYQWMYGMKDVRGVGVTFAIKQSNGKYEDVGNVVLMYINNIPTAVEFGIGDETFRARYAGLSSPYAVCETFSKLHFPLDPYHKRVGDALTIAFRLHEVGVIPGSGQASSVLRKALNTVVFELYRKHRSDITQLCKEYATRIQDDFEWIQLVCRQAAATQKRILLFEGAKRHIQNHTKGARLDRKVAEYRIRYGIPSLF